VLLIAAIKIYVELLTQEEEEKKRRLEEEDFFFFFFLESLYKMSTQICK
jgi:hypothetical protein